MKNKRKPPVGWDVYLKYIQGDYKNSSLKYMLPLPIERYEQYQKQLDEAKMELA